MKKIFIALSSFGECGNGPVRLLEEKKISYTVNPLKRRLTEDEILTYAKKAQGILAGVEPYSKKVLEHLKNLKCISRCGVGLDSIDLETARRKNIAIVNTPDVVTQPVAELTLAMIFDLLRKLTFHTHILRTQGWKKYPGHLLSSQVIGILGLGRIGKRVAEFLKNLNCTVLGSDIHVDYAWAKKTGVDIVDLDTLLQKSDILTLHLSVSSKHSFRLNQDHFSCMKKGAKLINVSRGSLVDETALIRALSSNHLDGAALDVYMHEPYQGPLTKFENVILTPHIATFTEQSRLQMELEATKNLIGFFENFL